MINFYGGPKGENYVVSHTFGNTQELLKDLELGGASPVDLNEIVMISYGLPGSEKYEENMKKDYSSDTIENFYFTYNPYLEYYPSVEHHFSTNGHSKLYTILDPRYETSYNGIKNMMQFGGKYCDICEDNKDRSVWIKINLTGKIKFKGKYIVKDAPDLKYNFNLDSGYDPNTGLGGSGITWHLASSIESAKKGEGEKVFFPVLRNPGEEDYSLFNERSINYIQSSSFMTIIPAQDDLRDSFISLDTNAIKDPEQEQLYAILEIHPQTAVDFTDFVIDRSGLQFNSYNFNSCLYQKVLKDTINYDDPFMYITFQGSNFAYKFLNSSIGSSPIINFNQDISFVDSNILPSITKNTELSNSRYQIFDLKLPYPSTIKSNEDKNGNTYLQLKYQETSENPEEEKIKEQTIYMPTLNVDVNSDGLNITFIKTDGISEKRSITIVPYFKVENGNLFWKIKGSDDSTYKDLGAMPEGPQGDKGDKGDKGDALQVTQQFSVTVESNINNRISMVDIAKTAFEMAMNKKYIDSTDIDQNYEVIIGGINYTNSTLQIQESYVMFFTLAAENNNNFTFTYDSKKIQFSYIPVSDIGGNIKYISSTENKSLILNTSEDYNPKDKIYGAEGLTAGETNKIGTKVFDIVGYEGTEGGVGYYVLENAEAYYDSMQKLINNYTATDTEYRGNIKLRWSIRSQLNYDYAGEILGIEKNEKNEIKLKVNNFFTNEDNIGEPVKYTSGRTYNYGPRFNYCYPLGYYIDKKTSGDMSHTTDATLYICDHSELGTRELYGQSYSFGKDNITQKDLSFQVGANNQGYNKYGITIGQNNISGYGNAIFGRNINAGFAQMNISQGDYNTIGNYAKYDAQFGWNLNSNYDNQYQFGKFNKNKKNNIVEIGYGTDNANRKNIFEIDKDGKIYSNEKEVLNDYNILPQLLPETTNLISLVTQFGEKLIDVTIDSKSYDHHFHGYYQIGNKNNILQNEHIYLLMLDIYIETSGVVSDGQIGTDSNTFCELLFEPNRSTDKLHFGKTFVGSYEKFSNKTQTTYTIFYPFKYTSEITQYGIGFMEPGFNITYTYKNPRLYELYSLSEVENKNKQAKLSNYDLKSEGFTNIFGESQLRSKDIDSTITNGIQNNIIMFTQDTSFENLFGDETNYLYNYSNEGYYIYEESKISKLKHLSYNTTLSYSKIKDDKTILLQCDGLSHNQDVMISFNPEEGIRLDDYKKQKDVYDLIISNSYAKTVDGAVEIHILDSNIIDISNTTECPILIKVV